MSETPPSPQDAEPTDDDITQVDQEIPPTPQGRADDDTDVRDDDGDTDVSPTD